MSLTQTNKLTPAEAAFLLKELKELRQDLRKYKGYNPDRVEKLDIIISKIENLYSE